MECFDDEKDLPSCSITDLPEHNSKVKIGMFNILQFTINQMIILMTEFNFLLTVSYMYIFYFIFYL